MLVSGSFAKIVGAGLLLKVSRSFVSDEGREGGAGEGGAERRAPPLVRASLNFLPAMRACGGKYPVLYVVVCVGRAHGEWFMLGRAYWKMRTATEHRNCTRLRRRSTCKDCIRGRKTESLKDRKPERPKA